MRKKQVTGAMLLTTALVAVSSIYATQVQADSSNAVSQPSMPLGAMGLSQASSLNTGLDAPESEEAAYWRSYGNGYGHHYNRGDYRGYGKKRSRRHRPDGNYEIRRPRPSDFETEEFKSSDTAAQSKAQFAYAKGADGSGVTVGVIDGQFDLDHPELKPNIVDFIDITAGNRLGQADIDDEDERRLLDRLEKRLDAFVPEGHGTLVSGVIAAARDGQGIHGLAPEADLVAIRVTSFDTKEIEDEEGISDLFEDDIIIVRPTDAKDPDDSQIFKLSEDEAEQAKQVNLIQDAVANENLKVLLAGEGQDLEVFEPAFVKGLDAANEAGVDIISISLGAEVEAGQEVRDAVVRTTDQGRIVVFSNGNAERVDEDGNPLEELPDAEQLQREIATDPRTNGLVLIATMIDKDNQPTANNCGTAKENCMVARGVDIRTTANGGGIETVSGSSFAAPTVSGGLALLLDLFPTLYAEEAVALVKRTADDLGEKGVDEVFGHGALNLERAVQPVGVASLPTGKNIRGKVVRLSSSKLGVSGAFGNAFGKAAALQQGFFLDEFRRPFKADLSQQVVAENRGINFEGVLGGSDIENETFVNPNGVQVSLSLQSNGQDGAFETPIAAFGSAQEAYDQENQLQTLRLSGEVTPGLSISSGFNLTAGQQLTADPASKATNGLFLFESDAVNPQHGFLGKGNGLSLTQDLTEATSLTVGFLTAGEQIGDRNGAGTTTQADLNHRFGSGAALGFTASFTQESEGFLGSEASGAFAAKAETSSQFYTLSGSLPMVADVEMFGSATVGLSDPGVNGGFVASIDRTTSSAFALGAVKKGVIDDKDRLGLRFSQPLRTEGAADATLSVSTSVNADGSINETSQTLSLQPTGRELNLQLAYTRQLADTLNVTNYALARSEPGHNADAKPDFGVGVRVNWNF